MISVNNNNNNVKGSTGKTEFCEKGNLTRRPFEFQTPGVKNHSFLRMTIRYILLYCYVLFRIGIKAGA